MNPSAKPVLVIGGGIAGMTSALEIAEVGYRVFLVEKEAYLGGRVLRSYRYFPKMCPPSCGFEINVRRIRRNPRITVFTQASVAEVDGRPGDFQVKINLKPRYVTGKHSIDNAVVEKLSSHRSDDFNLGMGQTKALYLPHQAAYPHSHVLDRETLSDADVAILKQECHPEAIDWDATGEEVALEVGAIVVATGWKPYDANKLDSLGFGQYQNVVTNVMMERLAADDGPTAGEIVRPSDGSPAQNVAFVQCAGSRDENHLPYCSAVCCMASLKQVRFLREKNPDAKATVFYIDVRTIGRLEKFYYDLVGEDYVTFVKGKVARISESDSGNNLQLHVEDTVARETTHPEFDMVVLATGMVPNGFELEEELKLQPDQYGFAADTEGVFTVGCFSRPCDVSRATKSATAAALKAIQCIDGGTK